MRNRFVAEQFQRLSDLIELRGLKRSESQSYRKAAHFIRNLTEDVELLLRGGRLASRPEVGPFLARKVREVLETGRLRRIEDLVQPVGRAVLELLTIPRVKVATLARIHLETGIASLKDLGVALADGRKGELGQILSRKEFDGLLRSIGMMERRGTRQSLGQVFRTVEDVVGILKGSTGSRAIEAVGPFRRGLLWMDRVEVLAAVPRDDVDTVREIFCSLPGLEEAKMDGRWRATARSEGGLAITLRCVPEGHLGVLSVVKSAGRAHLEALRRAAKRKGYRLAREYLYKGRRRVPAATERALYALLGLTFVPPERREDGRSVCEIVEGKEDLPRMIEDHHVRGDLHVHTHYSDGVSGLREIAEVAVRRGWRYVALCDHSLKLPEAQGLSVERLRRRNADIDAFNALGEDVVLLKGAEVEILPDGAVDYHPDVLGELDIVVGAVHHVRKTAAWMTSRILRALRTGLIDVLAHPTGSLIGQRPPYAVDLDEVFRACADLGVACEINCHKNRMDLSEANAERALAAGVYLSLGSDAHTADNMWMIRLGVAQARRAGAPRARVLNCMDTGELRDWIFGRRARLTASSDSR